MSKQNTTLSPALEALLGASRSIQDLDLNSLEKSIRDLENSPEHVAETRKAAFVEDVLRALDDDGVSKSELARRLGKSRQQLNIMLDEDKRNNFTIETMAKLSTALGRKLHVRMLKPEVEVQLKHKSVLHKTQLSTKPLWQYWSEEPAIGSRQLQDQKKAVEAKTLTDSNDILPAFIAA